MTEQMAVALHSTSADLTAAQAFTRALLDALPVGVAACDADGYFTISNQVTRDWTGASYRPDGQPSMAVLDDPVTWGTPGSVLHSEDCTPMGGPQTPLAQALRQGVVDGAEMVLTHPQHAARTVSCAGRSFHDTNGSVLGAVIVMTDITQTRRLENELRQAAMHDPLTGLPNRRLFHQALSRALAGPRESAERVALLYCDLDGFKTVNDDLGHDAGDQVLLAAADRMVGAVRPGDMVARLGGDEFAVLLSDVHPAEVSSIAARIDHAVAAPIELPVGTAVIGVSIGHVQGRGGDTPAALLRAGDHKMYAEKSRRHGRGGYRPRS